MGSSQSTISFLDDVLTNFDRHTVELDSKFLPLAANAKISLGTLKRAIIRDQIEAIAVEIQKGNLNDAKVALGDQKVFKIDVGTIEEVVRLAYAGDAANLLNAIKFAADFVPVSNLKFPALKAIFEEMQHLGHTHCVEILLLDDYLKSCGTDMTQIKAAVANDKKKLAQKIINDFSSNDYAKCIEIGNKLEYKFLAEIINAIVDCKYTSGMKNMFHFIQFFEVLEKPEFVGIAVYELFKKLKQKNALNTFEACNLWAVIKYLATISVSAQISADTNKLLKNARNEMEKHKDLYLSQQYSKLFTGTFDEQLSLRQVHIRNPCMRSILKDFVEYFYKGHASHVPILLNAFNELPLQIDVGVGLEAIYDELVNHKEVESFECYLLFKSLRRLTSLPDFEANLTCGQLTKRMPKSIATLLRLDASNKECRIVNNFYNEKLVFKAPDSLCTVPCEAEDENDTWTLKIDPDTELVRIFQHQLSLSKDDKDCTFAPLYLENKKNSSKDLPLMQKNVGVGWSIKPIGDDCIKIYKSETSYLTTENWSTSNLKQRIIQLKKEDNTAMQLWMLIPK